jgi:hypothetical protein
LDFTTLEAGPETPTGEQENSWRECPECLPVGEEGECNTRIVNYAPEASINRMGRVEYAVRVNCNRLWGYKPDEIDAAIFDKTS